MLQKENTKKTIIEKHENLICYVLKVYALIDVHTPMWLWSRRKFGVEI